MNSIVKAKEKDFMVLADIGKISFLESHGNSAAPADINKYTNEKYNPKVFKDELGDPNNIYHIIYIDDNPAGYSKIIFNSPHSNIPIKNITLLERIYLLKEYYNLRLGSELLQFNIELSQKNKQAGMWLFTWKENQRAIGFYKKYGFIITGSHDFKITDTHSNPNHQMCLMY
ncbi:MAG: GNAT family N-acetyltransferase [Ferruginibacter sp.]